MISKIKKFFSRKKPQEAAIEVKVKKDFNIDEFNEWFKTEFSGYDGKKGAPGIFLRLDKFSPHWVKSYLEYIGQEPTTEETLHYYDIIREDWLKKIYSK
jgi:hypothetical protein